MNGKASDGTAFDISATLVTFGDTTSADLFLGAAQFSDSKSGGASDQQVTVTVNKAVFSGAKLTSLSGSNITVTGFLVC